MPPPTWSRRLPLTPALRRMLEINAKWEAAAIRLPENTCAAADAELGGLLFASVEAR